MSEKIKVGIVGYGNVGKGVHSQKPDGKNTRSDI